MLMENLKKSDESDELDDLEKIIYGNNDYYQKNIIKKKINIIETIDKFEEFIRKESKIFENDFKFLKELHEQLLTIKGTINPNDNIKNNMCNLIQNKLKKSI